MNREKREGMHAVSKNSCQLKMKISKQVSNIFLKIYFLIFLAFFSCYILRVIF